MRRTAKQILEERAKLIADARKLNDSIPAGTAATPEQRAQLDKMLADALRMKDEADRASRFEVLDDADADLPGREDQPPGGGGGHGEPTDEQRTLAIAGWAMRALDAQPTEEAIEAARACGLRLGAKELVIPLTRQKRFRELQRVARSSQGASFERRMSAERIERRDMVTNVAGSGGLLTAPEDMIHSLEMARLQFGGVLQQATVRRTPTAAPIRFPFANDTGNTGAFIGEDQDQGTTSVDPTIGALTLNAHKLHSKPILATSEMIRDDAVGFVSGIFPLLGERLGRREAIAYATGDGASKPTGVVTGATLGVTTASASAITLDEVKRLVHSIDPAYRMAGCGFLMHDSTALELALLKDSDGRYLWQPSVVEGMPDMLFKFPVYICQEIATIAASAKTIVFGQLSAYQVRQVASVRLVRLTELFRLSNDADGFIAFNEIDGGLLDAGTHPVKYLQMHA